MISIPPRYGTNRFEEEQFYALPIFQFLQGTVQTMIERRSAWMRCDDFNSSKVRYKPIWKELKK